MIMDYMLYARDLGEEHETPDLCVAYVDVTGKDEDTVRFGVHMNDDAIRLCRRLDIEPVDPDTGVFLYERFELVPEVSAPRLGSTAVARLHPTADHVDVTLAHGDSAFTAGIRTILRIFADFKEDQ